MRLVRLLAVVMLVALPGMAFGEASDMLQKTVVSSLEYSPLLKSVEKSREAVAHDLRSAEGGFYPSLDLSGGAGSQRYDDATARRAGDEYDSYGRTHATATLTQMLFDGQDRVNRVDIEKARLDAAGRRLMDMAATVALEAVNAHMDVFRQRELVRLAEGNVAKHKEIMGSIEANQLQGAGSMADVMQARGRYARSRATLNREKSRLRIAMADYRRLTGTEPMAYGGEAPPTELSADVDAAVERAWSDNPGLLLKRAQIQEASKTVALREAGFFPNVDIEIGSSFKDHVDGDSSYVRSDTAMLVGNWNLFNGGADVADRKAAKARMTQTKMELGDLRDELAKSVREVWSDYEAEAMNIELYTEAIDYNAQTRDMYEQQFMVGQRSLLDVLDAENELFVSRGQLISARTAKVTLGYRLLALEGRLLYTLGIDASLYRSTQ